MKLLPALLLACVLALGVACSSEPPQVPDVPKNTEDEVIGLVKGLLRTHSLEECNQLGVLPSITYVAEYKGKGKWLVRKRISYGSTNVDMGWYVYERTKAIERDKGFC